MTYAEIDRMFYELLRRAVVLDGYLPNVKNYQTAEAYLTAKEVIKTGGNEIIEIFGPGAPDSKDKMVVNRILISRTKNEKGSIGAWGVTQKVRDEQTNKYTYTALPDSSRNITYDVRVVASSTEYERIMAEIIEYTLGEMRNLFTVDTELNFTTDSVLVEFMTDVLLPTKSDFQEHLYKYIVKDVWITGRDRVIKTNVPTLETVTFSVYLKAEPDSEAQPDLTITTP